MRVNGAGGVNERALHVCITGYAAQSSAQWHDIASLSAISIAGDVIHQWGVKHHLPTGSRLSVAQVKNGVPGVCGHVDVSASFAGSQGHTDPGVNFPWNLLLSGSTPAPPPPVKEAPMATVWYSNYLHAFWLDAHGAMQHSFSNTAVENMNKYATVVYDRTQPVTAEVTPDGILRVRGVASDGRLIRFDYAAGSGWGASAANPV
jgi:hypothetical protein